MKKSYFIALIIISILIPLFVLGPLGPLFITPLVVIILVEKGNKLNSDKKNIKYFVKKFYWINFKFNGRINRYEFFIYGGPLFFAILGIATIPFIIIESYTVSSSFNQSNFFSVIFGIIFGLFFIVHQFAVYIKRLHDLNKSGWFLLWQFLPIVGHILIFVLCWFYKGTKGNNNYGADPNNYYGIDPNYKEKPKPSYGKFKFKKNKIEERLEELKQLLDKKIISKEEYEVQRKKIISDA